MLDETDETEEPRLVLIGGVPGTLKSSTAVALAFRLGFCSVAMTDELREALRLHVDDPFLEGTSHSRHTLLGDYGEDEDERLLEGHRRQALLVEPAVRAVLAKNRRRGEDGVVEGVHLLPSLYAGDGLRQVVLVENDRDRLRLRLEAKFRLRPELAARFDEAKLDQLLTLQRAFVAEAEEAGALVLETETAVANAEAVVAWLEALPDA